ncbi:MAG: DUF421 domain-containing protein [Hoeflea sp.]|uniref:DUF421 domain-containing protein n=1 Tax=Hoeflea sp. TaxID=1940281 RepID=UPI003EF97CA9
MQYVTARLRRSSEGFEAIVQNSPILLMRDGKILHAALDATRVAKDDLIAKLREANVLDISDVRAVVLETTGDISVLHGPKAQDRLLECVAAEMIFTCGLPAATLNHRHKPHQPVFT